MIAGETLSFWRIICSWWYSATIKPVDLVLNSRVVAGFHLTHVKTRLPERYREALLHLFELYEKNVIRPQIDSVWTFSQVEYHRTLISSCIFILYLRNFLLPDYGSYQ